MLLENFSRDLKFTRSSLLNSAHCPQFPESEWTNILASRAVNLDHVLSSQFTATQDEKKAHRVGETEIELSLPAPAKSVHSHGDWVTAWGEAGRATAFVFPHRALELDRYTAYMLKQFAASPTDQHERIINLDKAIRNRVAQRRDIELTDFLEFVDLQTHWVIHGGGGSNKRPREGGAARKHEPCRKWNDERCNKSSKYCLFAHICSKCKEPGHPAKKCTAGKQ